MHKPKSGEYKRKKLTKKREAKRNGTHEGNGNNNNGNGHSAPPQNGLKPHKAKK